MNLNGENVLAVEEAAEACFGDPEDVGVGLAEHIRLCVGIVEKATVRFDRAVEGGIDGALEIFEEAKRLVGVARDLQNEAERLLIAAMGDEHVADVDGRIIEVRKSWKRTWDSPKLASAVAAVVLQGERIPEVDEVVGALTRAARMEWRTTELKKLGLKDHDFCTKELGRTTVSVS